MQSHGQKRTPEGQSRCCRKVTNLVRRVVLVLLVGLHNMKQALFLPLCPILLLFSDGFALLPRGLALSYGS